jgi:hypothetical protein
VIIDDYLREATPAQAAEGLRFCASIPGCQSLWQPGMGTIVILRPTATEPPGIDTSPSPSD